MARFEAFRGTTYVADRVVADDVIAPPYDIVNPAERSELAARSPYNAIHVELPAEGEGLDPYEHAASLFSRWHAEGAVTVAEEAGYYMYRMTFADEDGATRTTTGAFGALGLDPDQRGDVLPHEQTIPKDKRDRLSLLRAARTNFSPIWGLSIAEGFSEVCAAAVAAAPREPWRATDGDGVVHECWTVTEPAAISRISAVVAGAPVLIADGHHRYETACTYYAENPASAGTGAVLAFVVELAETQLSVRAIHRLLNGLDPKVLPSLLERYFDPVPGPADPIALRDAMAAEGALGLITPEGSWLLRMKPALIEAATEDLDSSRLAYALTDLGITDVTYQHGAVLARDAVASGAAAAAVLLRPVTMRQIAATARGGFRMPPKSTFFHPKPRTGMVFRELERS